MAMITMLGGCNMAAGVVNIIFYAIIIGIKVPMYETGCGLWDGALFITAGALGVWAGKAKNRISQICSLVFCVLATIADIAALALSIYVFYFLTQVYPDSREVMPIYQVYVAFHTLWFLVVLVSFFTILVQLKMSLKIPPAAQKGNVYVDGQHQPSYAQPGVQGGQYQPAPRPYYY